MKILIFGLPGSGKSYISERLSKLLGSAWYNADIIRQSANDWDFSHLGRLRQQQRMKTLANFESSNGRIVISDFVCPLKFLRDDFYANVTIWMNTIPEGRYEDTNKMFEVPENADFIIDRFLSDDEIEQLAEKIKERINV